VIDTLDSYSLVAIYSAMAVYTIAFVMFALDLAKRSAREPAAVTTAGQLGNTRGVTATLQKADAEPEPPRYKFERIGYALVALGWVLHVAGVILRGVAQGFVPWANMFEFSLTSSAIVVGVFVVIQRWQDLKFLGVYITGFALITLGVGTVNFYVPVKPLPDALDSYWLIIHVFVASLGTAFFAIGAGLSVVQLLQARREAGKKSLGMLKTLPDAVKLENLAYLVTVVGFLGTLLGLGHQRGVDLHHLGDLRRVHPRQGDPRLARGEVCLAGHHRLRVGDVQLHGGEPVLQRTALLLWPVTGGSWPSLGLSTSVRLAELHHGSVELFVCHWRLGDRVCALSTVSVEHEVEVTPPGIGRGESGGVDHPAVRPDEVHDVGQGEVGPYLSGFLGSSEHILDLAAHPVMDALGFCAARESAGEKVIETSVAGLNSEQVLQV
jgi:ABC-type uncharacterized transport system permease subunit